MHVSNLRCAIARCNAEKFKGEYHSIDPNLNAGTMLDTPEEIINDNPAVDLDDDLNHLD